MSEPEIAGRYRLKGRLGFGGMSTVHLALDVRLERAVAVKLLAEHLAEDPTFVSRFQREAQAAARLVHPNIVQVFDSGQDERTGQYFIVMEYIEGVSCAEILRDEGWVEVEPAIAIVEQACEGLDYAHRHGVVHRDVKPGNLLRAREGQVKLADFGIAKATEQSSITQVGSVLGTAAYLAPEQSRGDEATPQSDLYSLGVVTYQLLTGKLPYEATSLSELVLQQQQGAPPLLHELNPDVPTTLSAAVGVALSIHPRGRYETAKAMGDALDAAAQGVAPPTSLLAGETADWDLEATSVLSSQTEPTRAVRRTSPSAPREPVPARRRTEAPAAPPAARPRRSPTRAIIIGLIALLVVAGIAVAVASSSGGQKEVQLTDVTKPTVNESVDAMKQLV